MTYWINPWENAVSVPIEELAECHAGLGEPYYSSSGTLILTKETVLTSWQFEGYKLDAYILPQLSGYHSIGIRYGNEPSEYLSPAGDKEKVQALLDKYKFDKIAMKDKAELKSLYFAARNAYMNLHFERGMSYYDSSSMTREEIAELNKKAVEAETAFLELLDKV